MVKYGTMTRVSFWPGSAVAGEIAEMDDPPADRAGDGGGGVELQDAGVDGRAAGVGIRAADGEDKNLGEQLVDDGLEEATHDQMLEARIEERKEEES